MITDNYRFELWLRTATNGRMLKELLRGQRTIMSALNVLAEMEYDQMADFSRMNAKVSRISDLATSIKTAYDEAITARDTYKAERDALAAADSTDQAAVDAAEASLAAAEAIIASLTAVAAGTPVELPPDTGGQSIGGANPAID